METEKPQSSPSRRGHTLGVFLVIQLVLIILLIASVLYLWFSQQSQYRRTLHLHTAVFRQQQQLTTLQAGLQSLAQPQEKRLRALNEAQYLSQLANINMTFQGNTALATELLKLAEQQIADINDPTLMPVRQALTEDITALQIAPKVDIAGIILKINALSQQLPKMPVLPTLPKTQQAQMAPIDTRTTPTWQKGLQAVGHAFTKMVVIRRLDQPIEPFLIPDKQAYLMLNMQLKLSQAQWATIHGYTPVYEQNLQQVIDWIKQYFQQNSPITQNVLTQLQELQKMSIKVNTPLLKSLNSIQNALNVAAIKS